MAKKALITGITGMDGSYLAELLIDKGYEIHGIIRRSSSFNTGRIDHIFDKLHLYYGDVTDTLSLEHIIQEVKPDEIYNLAAQSHVAVSFELPEYTGQVDGLGVLKLLEAVKRYSPDSKIYQASTSELFGKVQEIPQKETTPFYPRSPYAAAKLYAYWICRNYREAYNLFISNGILFNHESERRGETFVTKKITKGLVNWKKTKKPIHLGNLNAKRDWGYAKDYCVDLDTSILTNKGFKYRNQIKNEDIIINYNLQNEKWENDKIIKIYDVPYIGKMYTFKGNNLIFRCSENHRIIYKRKTKKHKYFDDVKWKECSAGEFYKLFKEQTIREKYNFCFPGFHGSIEKEDLKIINDDMIKLIGYIVSEGHLHQNKEIGRGIDLSVSQSRKKYFEDLKTCIDNLNLKYSIRKRDDDLFEFTFDSESRNKILDYFDSYDIHDLPNYIFEMSTRQLNILFTSMMNGDGSWACTTYVSKRKKLAMDFKLVCEILGYKTSIKKRVNGDIYNVHFFGGNKTKYSLVDDIEVEDVEENIWCVETDKNKTIITKKDDTTFISGNCNGMWLMLQQEKPDDFILATGESHSNREFVEEACKYIDVEIEWKGDGLDEIGVDKKTGKDIIIQVDPKYFRPTEVDLLLGDPTKAKEILGWEPKTKFKDLVKIMMDYDIEQSDDSLLRRIFKKKNK